MVKQLFFPDLLLNHKSLYLWLVTRLFSVICLVSLISACVAQPFTEEAEQQFIKSVNAHASQKYLLLLTDKIQYQSGRPVHFWIENKTNQTIWFPDGSFAAEGYKYDTVTKSWQEVDLGIIRGTPKQAVPPGKSDLRGIPIWEKVPRGPLRLILRGSTSENNPGIDGDVYVTYMDVLIT